MTTQPDTTTGEPAGNPGPTPIWAWLLVLAFGAAALFAAHVAFSKNELYWESESARQTLQHDKNRLEANISDLKHQLEQANAAREETANALKQSRADTETASAQIGELRVRVNDLEGKLATAEAEAKQATAARETLGRDVERLKGELADAQQKLAAAQAALAQTQGQNQSQLTPAAPDAGAPAPR